MYVYVCVSACVSVCVCMCVCVSACACMHLKSELLGKLVFSFYMHDLEACKHITYSHT